MIKKTQSKVFMIVMISLSVIIISVISVINIVNFSQRKQQSYMMLDNASGILKQITSLQYPPPNNENNMYKHPEVLYWKTAQFYFVVIKDNQVIQTINDDGEKYTNEQINKYALDICKKDKNYGSIKDLVYEVKNFKEYKIITFMDNSIANKNLKNMIILSIFIGFIALSFAYIISRKISLWIIKPIEDTLNRQKQFISDASHELKTPLAVICANADILEGEIGNNKWLNYIQREVCSMDKLVNSLLSLARIEKSGEQEELIDINLSKVVTGSTMVFESLAYEKEIQVIDDIQDGLILKGNSEEIKQLLSILIDNAIKHTNKGNQVFVILKKYKNNIILKVKNEGEPIPKGEEEKIFERFYRSDKSRNRDSKRYGLGLAIAKSIVQKHNGSIKASCQNGFTTFTVVF